MEGARSRRGRGGVAGARGEGTEESVVLDVWREGDRARRGVPVAAGTEGLRLGDATIPYASVYWVSRRSGLLMVFGREEHAALKGPGDELERLVRRLDRRIDRRALRARLLGPLAEEVVVFSAGVAALGTIAGSPLKGLYVAAATRRGLHLFGRDRRVRIGWPAEEAARRRPEETSRPGEALLLRQGGERIRLLYLFPEEIDVVLRLASGPPAGASGTGGVETEAWSPAAADPAAEPRREPAGGEERADVAREDPSADAPEERGPAGDRAAEASDEPAAARGGTGGIEPAEPGGSLEMFARREVAPPVPPDLPRPSLSVEVLQAGAEEAASRLRSGIAERAGLGVPFFETHLMELGEIALGPVLLRKSAAAGARDLRRAVEAMDAGALRADTRAAVANAAERLQEVYAAQLDRLLAEKRAPARVGGEQRLGVEEVEEIRVRMQAHFDRLASLFRALEERGRAVLERLDALESGPPEARDDGVRETAGEWKEVLRKVDRAYESAWRDLAEEVTREWNERLLPRLARIGSMRRRRMPEWIRLTLTAVATALVIAALMILLIW